MSDVKPAFSIGVFNFCWKDLPLAVGDVLKTEPKNFLFPIVTLAQCLRTVSQTKWIRSNICQVNICLNFTYRNQNHISSNIYALLNTVPECTRRSRFQCFNYFNMCDFNTNKVASIFISVLC